LRRKMKEPGKELWLENLKKGDTKGFEEEK
jgi:hypothetical protein